MSCLTTSWSWWPTRRMSRKWQPTSTSSWATIQRSSLSGKSVQDNLSLSCYMFYFNSNFEKMVVVIRLIPESFCLQNYSFQRWCLSFTDTLCLFISNLCEQVQYKEHRVMIYRTRWFIFKQLWLINYAILFSYIDRHVQFCLWIEIVSWQSPLCTWLKRCTLYSIDFELI